MKEKNDFKKIDKTFWLTGGKTWLVSKYDYLLVKLFHSFIDPAILASALETFDVQPRLRHWLLQCCNLDFVCQ